MKTYRRISFGRPPGAYLLHFTLAITVLLLQACMKEKSDLDLTHADSCSGRNAGTALVLSLDCDNSGTRAESWWLIQRVDIFVFNDDRLRMLDSYNRCYNYSTTRTNIVSGNGDKLVVVIANAHLTDEQIASVNRYEDMEKLTCHVSEDDPACPVMSGEGVFTAGSDAFCQVTLSPIMSVIEISSIVFRPTGELSGARATDMRVYLTNLSERCEIIRNDGFIPMEILNQESYQEADMRQCRHPEMFNKYIGNGQRNSEGSWSYGSATLYCYPNESSSDSWGSPFTYINIECTINGKECCYRIPVNRPGYGFGSGTPGIGRNCRYVMDIEITKTPREGSFP